MLRKIKDDFVTAMNLASSKGNLFEVTRDVIERRELEARTGLKNAQTE
jgi:hypothetical protein